MDPVVPANLRQPCQELLEPTDGTGAGMLNWALGTVEAYRICKDRHAELVKAVGGQ